MNNPSALIILLQKNIELVFWVGALVLLFIMKAGTAAQSLCLFKWLNNAYSPAAG